MKRHQLSHRPKGIATVEFAFVALLAILVMQLCWWAGRALWQHSVLENATRDAARLIATLPPGELASSAGFFAARLEAENLIQEVAQSNRINFQTSALYCNGSGLCSVAGLQRLRLEVQATFPESVFPVFGGDGIPVVVAVEVPYDGRFAFQ